MASRGQNFQSWNYSRDVLVENNYTLASRDTSRYRLAANQEDSINFGLTDRIIARGNYIVGGQSPSGCGLIADEGANYAQFLNNVLIDTGQCGIGISDGFNHIVDGNRIINSNPVRDGGNTAIYVWKVEPLSPPCSGVKVSNNIASQLKPDGTESGFWDGGGCDPVTLWNNVFDSAARAELMPVARKLAPPLIPPQPYTCPAPSPYTNRAGCNSSL